ncbi:MAG: Gfo/Idh/MocA family oxidoreductase [Candidatus Hydrogenedentes bacterium]|nr:Gfo/Idh/MocA family oxidoreductase [Candidatus Hydrogenedentota bacterium]
MALRVAFVGYQAGHAYSLHSDLDRHPDIEIVAACEEDPEVRAKAGERGINITHTSYAQMLAEVPCDAVACADWYGIRGARHIEALKAGKHVTGDKPMCTRLSEVDEIGAIAHAKHLKVGCQLPVQYHPPFVTAQKLVRDGAIGDVHSVTFNGAHTLNYPGRPVWMFDADRYGGSINDIAIHGIDALPWLTGRTIAKITVAREWNARVPEHPTFHDGAVVLFKLDNGGAVYGDVSWLSPDDAAYKTPFYWRFTIMGSRGTIETSWNAEKVQVYKQGAKKVIEEAIVSDTGHDYVVDWLLDIANTPALDRLHTDRVLRGARTTLLAQHAAAAGLHDVAV